MSEVLNCLKVLVLSEKQVQVHLGASAWERVVDSTCVFVVGICDCTAKKNNADSAQVIAFSKQNFVHVLTHSSQTHTHARTHARTHVLTHSSYAHT